MTNPTPSRKAQVPARPCPACATVVPADQINPNALTSNVSDASIDALRLRRRARRTGDIESALRLRQTATEVGNEAPDAHAVKGDDVCPACGTENVRVNESKLSAYGKRLLASGRQDSTSAAVDEIRKRKGAASVARIGEHNRRAAAARSALRPRGA